MQAAYEAQLHVHDNFDRMLRDQAGMSPDSPKVGWRSFDTKFIRLTDAERNVWKDYLSVARNKDALNELIDRYGRKEYELVVRVANAPGTAKPQPWWKA